MPTTITYTSYKMFSLSYRHTHTHTHTQAHTHTHEYTQTHTHVVWCLIIIKLSLNEKNLA